jgi:hypothetical protein
MRSEGTGTQAINIGCNKAYNGRTEQDNWGEKGSQKRDGLQPFPNGRAKIITDGSQGVSLEVVSGQ